VAESSPPLSSTTAGFPSVADIADTLPLFDFAFNAGNLRA
jgi:hypothetical protein